MKHACFLWPDHVIGKRESREIRIKTKNERDAHRAALHSAEVIRAMRDWIADCWWPDLDSSEIDELSDEDVIAGVVRHFDGGVSAFLATMEVGA